MSLTIAAIKTFEVSTKSEPSMGSSEERFLSETESNPGPFDKTSVSFISISSSRLVVYFCSRQLILNQDFKSDIYKNVQEIQMPAKTCRQIYSNS